MSGAGRLFLIRHAQTDGNSHHYVGWEDLELNARGHAQAVKVGRALAGVHLDAIFYSPLRRALQTAAHCSRTVRRVRAQPWLFSRGAS